MPWNHLTYFSKQFGIVIFHSHDAPPTGCVFASAHLLLVTFPARHFPTYPYYFPGTPGPRSCSYFCLEGPFLSSLPNVFSFIM